MNGSYYNENDPNAAEWLRNLISGGLIAPGDVDERSIADVGADDLRGYAQCHFFAGIGGWSYALRLAGWPDDRPVWTGSCPCQPFSAAGKRKGTADARHLWPEFDRLIAECRPPVVFGEQVASKDGRHWLAGVRADLEALGYGVGAADLCAAGVRAPHIRQRLYWLGHAAGSGPLSGALAGLHSREEGAGSRHGEPERSGGVVGVEYPDNTRLEGRSVGGDCSDQRPSGSASLARGVEHPANVGRERLRGARNGRSGSADAGPNGFWDAFDILDCTDGKARRIEPGSFPLAHGVPGRVGKLRAFGNAIVPQVAAEFIGAYIASQREGVGA